MKIRPILPLTLLVTTLASAKPLSPQEVSIAAKKVDSLIAADLQRANLNPTSRIHDDLFLRRAYLGIIGRIPTEQETRQYFADTAKDKRSKLIDRLVASPGFDSHLFNWAADLLRVQTRQEQFGIGWHVWLRQSLAEDKPWDQMVGEMLSSSGHCATDPAVGYYLRDRNMQLDNFSNTMQVFLGQQVGCAQCHDHPFDDWTQHDYYQMAAFGGGITYRSDDVTKTIKRVSLEIKDEQVDNSSGAGTSMMEMAAEDPKKARKKLAQKEQRRIRSLTRQFQPIFRDFNRNAIVDNPGRQLRLPEDYQYTDAEPKSLVEAETLFGPKLKGIESKERLDRFAAWVTAPENPYFTKVIVNRLWERTFGHGLHAPVDDWKSDSEIAHPEVLAHLDGVMKEVDFDLRQFLRVLYHTKLFQQECEPTEPVPGVPHHFRGPTLRRMTAEQLYDSFLVLNRGKVNDLQVSVYADAWEDYRRQVAALLNAEAEELVVLAESAKQGEELFRKSQSEIRKIQQQIADTKDSKAIKRLREKLQTIRKELEVHRKQREPLRRYNRANLGKEGQLARASEQPAPFNPGTLVREFGGSDRATPSSSDTFATVPQALALLNDSKTDIAAERRNHLGQKLKQSKSANERLETMFLALYSRFPTAAEIERYTPIASKPEGARELARAMLTSNQFLFVQ